MVVLLFFTRKIMLNIAVITTPEVAASFANTGMEYFNTVCKKAYKQKQVTYLFN